MPYDPCLVQQAVEVARGLLDGVMVTTLDITEQPGLFLPPEGY